MLFGVTSFLLQAQGVSQQYLNYIERYKGMAIDQMLRYKIPASITLAQGLLESGAGTSTLARKANNHFGIKCGRAWKGPYVLQDDDERNEKFRKYRSVEESYEDHSRFLQQARYSSLFDLSPKDLVYRNNENYYIIARAGDTFDLLAEETGVSARDIRKFNELPKGYRIQAGDVLYLERKRKKAAKKYKDVPHVVKAGESMYNIAQRYGIRLESLYDMNNLPADYAIQVNDRLRVR